MTFHPAPPVRTAPFLGLAASGDTSGAADAANIQGLLNLGAGTVLLAAGKFWTNATVTNTASPTYIRGAGRNATTIAFVGTGDCIRLFDPAFLSNATPVKWGGGVLDLTIDGTNAGAGSTGLHIGDNEQYELNVAVLNFSGAGSIGVHLDNTVGWTEKCHGTIMARNCTQHVVFDVSGATTSTSSYGYLDLTCYVYVQADQDGIVLQNGAYAYHGRLVIKGNVQNQTGHVATNALLRITGTVPAGHPAAGQGSQIARCRLDIQAEVPSNTSGSTFQPFSIIFNSAPTNAILGCYGIMDFTQGTGTFQPCATTVNTAAGVLSYDGYIVGDQGLNPPGNFAQPVSLGTQLYAQSFMSGANGNTFMQWGDFFSCTLSASITLDLTPDTNLIPGPQRKIIRIIQAAAGGPFTVTWPHTGSPTVSSPTVNWAGGAAPTMSAGASAVDIYELVTFNGATWYGTATQNVS